MLDTTALTDAWHMEAVPEQQRAPVFQNWYWWQSRLGYGRSRLALNQLRVKTPRRVVMPLSGSKAARSSIP
jgi:hypothetical protein